MHYTHNVNEVMESAKRTQAERRATTRRTLLDATIEMLMESGLSACSLGAVAKRAGMTTGAVQHHFKTKAELIRAVISERLFGQTQSVDWEQISDQPLSERCNALVEHQWQFYSDPKYLAMWDIILGARSDDLVQKEIREWQRSGTNEMERAIAKLFSDLELSTSDISNIQYFVNAHLRGLALLRTVQDDAAIITAQLALLKSSLIAHVSNK